MQQIFRLFCSGLFLASVAAAGAPQPWDTPFAADTGAILKAAREFDAGKNQPVAILLEDHHYAIDSAGKLHATMRKVYRVIDQDGVDDWSSVDQQYQPWREDRPRIRARVIAPDGSVHLLDQKTISEAAASQFDSTIFSDERVVRVPLPAVSEGAVVELEIATDTSPALPGSGVLERIFVDDSLAIERFHIDLTAAKNIVPVTGSGLIPADSIHRSTVKGETKVELDLGPYKAREDSAGSLPSGVAPYPYFSFSTAQSWQALASAYSDLVDRQIRGADLKELLNGIDLKAPPLVVATKLAEELHQNVRYTGLELAESAIVPSAPAETLRRKYGDCKDKSTLLVALLRAAGLKANVALLLSGFGFDVNPDLPGIDLFDHAIVRLDSGTPVWIDATAEHTRIGVIPPGDQGRLALVASPGQAGLLRIPEQSDAWMRTTFEIHFKGLGRGSVTEIQEASGLEESSIRSRFSGANGRDAAEKYVKSEYTAKSLGKLEVEGALDLSKPPRSVVEAVETPQVSTGTDNAEVIIGEARVFGHLPYELRTEDNGETKDSAKSAHRSADFEFPETGRFEDAYTLIPPPLFKAATLPQSEQTKIGPLTYSREYSANEDGSVAVLVRLDVPTRRVTAAEFETIREGVQKYATQPGSTIHFVPETAELFAAGETGKGLSVLRDYVAKSPADVTAHIRYSNALLEAGFGAQARSEAKTATELDPASSDAWAALSFAWQCDLFGRRFSGDWNRPEALRYMRKALEVSPEDSAVRTELAVLLEFNETGERYGAGADLADAIALYREILKRNEIPVIHTNLTAALFYDNQLDAAAEEAARTPEPQGTTFLGAVTAIRKGAAAAVVDIQAKMPDPAARTQYLTAGALVLMHGRHYKESNIFLQAAARVAKSPEITRMATMFAQVKPVEELLPPKDDPTAPLIELFRIILSNGKLDKDKLAAIMTAREKFENFDEAALTNGLGPVLRTLSSIGLTRQNLLDVAMATMTMEKTGDEAHGYRIDMTFGGQKMVAYVAREGDSYRILGMDSSAENLGALVLDLLKQNKVADAQWWLDKLANDVKPEAGNSELPSIRGLWSGATPETRGPDVIRLAGASLMGAYSKSPEAIRILLEGRAAAKDGLLRSQIDNALCEAYMKTQQWTELAVVAKRLMSSYAMSHYGFVYYTEALTHLADWKTMEAAASEGLAGKGTAHDKTVVTVTRGAAGAAGTSQSTSGTSQSEDPDDLQNLAAARIHLKDAAGANEAIGKLKTAHIMVTSELDFWNELINHKATTDDLTKLRNDSSKDAAPTTDNLLHMALMGAVLEKGDEALRDFRDAIGNEDPGAIDARAWVAYGLVCRQYGYHEDAEKAFAAARKARGPAKDVQFALALID